VSKKNKWALALVTLLVVVGLLGSRFLAMPATAQTLFTSEDFRADREHWTDPAYFRNNTIAQMHGMSFDYDSGGEGTGQVAASRLYGSEGSGADAFELTTPYPYATSEEHYQAWLEEANGGTQHDALSLPDWSGRWRGNPGWLNGRQTQASTLVTALTPDYQEHLVQQEKAESEGRHFWPASFCLPRGFLESVLSAPKEFILLPHQVWVIGDTYTENLVRWIYTDGSGHSPENMQFAKWHGETIGFWDGDTLVMHTNQIRAWMRPLVEWSDQLTTVERYQRVGDSIMGEITLYDPIAFVEPLHAKISYEQIADDDPLARPIYNTCTDTNGPSSNVFINEDGLLDQLTVGDPGYWNFADPRPWAGFYAIGE
jgi:hypothetical protein